MSKTRLIPKYVIDANRSDPMAVINFLRRNKTIAVAANPEELVDWYVSTPCGPYPRKQTRGFGYDCTCFGTGWKNGWFMCGRHIPKLPLEYYIDPLDKD